MNDTTQLRRWVHHLIIGIAFAIACGRIVSVQRVYEPAFFPDPSRWPATKPDSNSMFGSNDRARWATVRALVHEESFVIGKRETKPIAISAATMFAAADPLQAAAYAQAGYDIRTNVANPKVHNGIIFREGLKEHGWATIDRVLDPNTLEFHSSKPPLLSTILACIYWLLLQVPIGINWIGETLFGKTVFESPETAMSLIDHPVRVVRAMLVLVNALPFAGYLWLLSKIAERWGRTDWGKIYIVAAGAFATTVSPFLITLQNHTFGTFAIMAAWWSVLCIWDQVSESETPDWRHFVSAGFFGAFAAACEMPALSFLAATMSLLLWWAPLRTIFLFVPAAVIPAVAFFGTNYLEVGQLEPVQSQFTSSWYRYEGSHWMPHPEPYKKTGIDWAHLQESRADYALHLLVGHHGLFTHSPIWLLAAIAMIVGFVCLPLSWRDIWSPSLVNSLSDAPIVPGLSPTLVREKKSFPWFVQPLGLVLSVVVMAFYITSDLNRNYGGFSNGLRWLMWLTPIWLTCLLPAVDRLATASSGRWLAGACLLVSIMTASYQLWSPWRQPWMYDLMIEMGWKGY
jgi:hypothetical protein